MNTESNYDIVNKKVLRASAILVVGLAIFGITVGFLTSSQAILFDGLFNLVGIGITLTSIIATRFITKSDFNKYPFGKDSLEPFVAIVQYALILYICISNIINAVNTILSGGHLIDLGSGVLYGFFAALFNILVVIYLRKQTQEHSSVIAEVEIAQWKFSCWLSCALLVGFGASLLMERTTLVVYTPYMDGFLTILITLMFIRIALISIKDCLKELLQAKPSEEISAAITEKEASISSDFEFLKKIVRLGKVGGQIIIEVDYVIEEGSALDSISEQDKLRALLIQAFMELPFKKWISVSFTGDEKWINHYM